MVSMKEERLKRLSGVFGGCQKFRAKQAHTTHNTQTRESNQPNKQAINDRPLSSIVIALLNRPRFHISNNAIVNCIPATKVKL